jgi:hypothetical protein
MLKIDKISSLFVLISSLIAFDSFSTPVSAQAAYGSYIGVGATYGLTSDRNNEGNDLGAVVSFRYKFLELPISFRTQALIADSVAIVPSISYDIPLNWQTDAYIGFGAAFPTGNSPSPVGDRTSFALQPGVDFMLPNTQMTVFTNAIIAFDAYHNGGGAAISIQGGLGLKF